MPTRTRKLKTAPNLYHCLRLLRLHAAYPELPATRLRRLKHQHGLHQLCGLILAGTLPQNIALPI